MDDAARTARTKDAGMLAAPNTGGPAAPMPASDQAAGPQLPGASQLSPEDKLSAQLEIVSCGPEESGKRSPKGNGPSPEEGRGPPAAAEHGGAPPAAENGGASSAEEGPGSSSSFAALPVDPRASRNSASSRPSVGGKSRRASDSGVAIRVSPSKRSQATSSASSDGSEFGNLELHRHGSTCTPKSSIFDDDEQPGVDPGSLARPRRYPWTREEILIGMVYVNFYAIVTRLPMIFGVVHMRTVYHLSAAWCALFFCAYCVGRMIAAYCVQWRFCMSTMLLSTSAGLVGFAVIFIFEDYWIVFGCMCFVLGLAETVTGFDVMLKRECQLNGFPKRRQQKTFRLCMISTTVGSASAYCLGGLIYQEFEENGCRAVCVLGMASALVQLLCLLTYAVWRWDFVKAGLVIREEEPRWSQADGTASMSSCMTGVSAEGFRRDNKTLGSYRRVKLQFRVRRASQMQSEDKALEWAPPTVNEDMKRAEVWMMCSVVGSMYVTPMAVGTNFATLAYYWLEVWNQGTSVSGAFMAAGECLGVVVLLFFQWPRVFNARATFYFGKPMNVCLCSAVIGLCCFLVVTPHIVLSALGSIGVHMFNAAIHSFCNELCAIVAPPQEFAEWQGRTYLAKRFSNCTMGFVQTVLSAVAPWAPHLAAGAVMTLWGGLLSLHYLVEGLAPHQIERRLALLNQVLQRLTHHGDDHAFDGVIMEVPSDAPSGVVPTAGGDMAMTKVVSLSSLGPRGKLAGLPQMEMSEMRRRNFYNGRFVEEERERMAKAIEAEAKASGVCSPMHTLSFNRLAQDRRVERYNNLAMGRVASMDATGYEDRRGGAREAAVGRAASVGGRQATGPVKKPAAP